MEKATLEGSRNFKMSSPESRTLTPEGTLSQAGRPCVIPSFCFDNIAFLSVWDRNELDRVKQ